MMYKFFVKPLLFLLPPETAHNVAAIFLKLLHRSVLLQKIVRPKKTEKDNLSVVLAGIHFPNRLGLAAGFDKNAEFYNGVAALGFGFMEIGTVTPLAQEGNPKPRLFRLKADQAIINRMGFNNKGLDKIVENLKIKRCSNFILGGNIGKNKITPNQEAVSDYLLSVKALYPYVDYFAVNVSSPNTPGLRSLQEKEPLTNLLSAVAEEIVALGGKKPLFLKIAPDLDEDALDEILQVVKACGLHGIIATNTTIERKNLSYSSAFVDQVGMGGLSGNPLKNKSLEIVKYLGKRKGNLVLMGVGGISSVNDAKKMLEAGADLVQLYSGLIYQGPKLVKEISRSICE